MVWIRQKNTGFGIGTKKQTEHFCWLMPSTNHVNLGFNYDAGIPDPQYILEGSGKLFRHFKINLFEELSNPYLTSLLKYASTYRVY